MTVNQRLRAATTFSPHNNPTSMAVRLSGGGGTSLGAIAGPMGINVVDLAAPQNSVMVLNYSSSSGAMNAYSGGINIMAFQPQNNHSLGNNLHQSSSSVLLATARGSGILIWDCSGRALSPLLGRLNAADSWNPGRTYVESGKTSSQNASKADVSESDSGVDNAPPAVAAASTAKSLISNATATLDTVQSMSSPSTALGQNTNTSTSIPLSNSVTSLAWKGPTVPILISTSESSVCLWDLRTSILSGGTVKGGGARPNSRFLPPSKGGTLIHCAYAYDESQHMFSTLDSEGVVRVWDDRKARNELTSFVACSRYGVGIASLPPSANYKGGDSASTVESRWLTWGMDNDTDDDDLIVKVWSPLSATKSNIESDDKDDSKIGVKQYQVTSRVPITNAVAARTHPAFPDVVLVFKSSLNASGKDSSLEYSSGASIVTAKRRSLEESPEWRGSRSPEMSAALSTPPSPPLLMLHSHDENDQIEQNSSKNLKGWNVELWRIDTDDNDLGTKEEEDNGISNTFGAQKIVSFCGGGSNEDALSFVPNRVGENAIEDDVIAIDLSLGSKLEGRETDFYRNCDELVLCSLTKKGYLRVYSIPEISTKEAADDVQDVKSTIKARIYRGHDDDVKSSLWWKGQNENQEATVVESPKKDVTLTKRENSTQFDIELTSPFEQHVPIDTRSIPIISEINEEASSRSPNGGSATNEEMDVSTPRDAQNVPIDPEEASRVPCPPLCGAVFCAGGAGGLVTFTNGPVGKMFAWYKSSSDAKRGGILNSLHNQEMPLIRDKSYVATESNIEASLGGKERNIVEQKLPRTVFDLLEMQSSAKIAQWGHDDHENNADPADEGDASGSSDDDSSSSSSYEDVEVELESESSDSDEEGFFHVSKSYNDYFSAARKSLLEVSADSDSITNKQTDKIISPIDESDADDANKYFAGPSSISPSVAISGQYNGIVYNSQTPELANLLKLGNCWWLTEDFLVPDYDGTHSDSDTPAARRNDNKSMHRNISDPSLIHSPSWPGLERTWSLQPVYKSKNKQTSMMGKLMPPGVNMSTPPDQRLIDKKEHQFDVFLKHQSLSKESQRKDSTDLPLGVYVVDNPQTPDAAVERLSITRNLCIQNAEICLECGQQSKADTWHLIAQTIESMEVFEADVFDGWGGTDDALTTGIIEQILRYYESQADYQMLATIVCVLTLGRDRRSSSKLRGKHDVYQLLPNLDHRRYDNYLYQYSSLLYGWGILTIRSEILKRLTYDIPEGEKNRATHNEAHKENSTANTRVDGITFTPICQKCLTPANDSNVCRKCNDFAFQCSICCHPVRGASLWCNICGHGGHAEHMISWFKDHQMCPTGCGCVCMMKKI